ncbi:MAG TPA: AgmX/PglI C-terminal domain-containing protein [Polyangiales bacterium]
MRGERSSDRAADALDSCAPSGATESSNEVESTWSRAELGLDRNQRVASVLHAERWTFFSLGVHTLALFCMALMPPKSSALALDMLGEDVRYAKYLATPVELDPPSFLDDGGSDQSAEGARAKDSEGAQGAPEAPRKPARRASGREPHMHRDYAREEARNAGILGVLHASTVGSMLVGKNMFDSSRVATDASAALGALLQGGIGTGFGFNGLGMRGTGRGGGGNASGTIGVGKLGAGLGGTGYCGDDKACPGGFRGRDAKVPQVRSTGAEVHGSLAKEAIRRTIQRHLNEVRFCYTEGLRNTPELAGRVQVTFLITSAGTVQEANVLETDLHKPEVERCIAEAVRRWTFPAPDGGGYVMVRYPFVFEQIGQ